MPKTASSAWAVHGNLASLTRSTQTDISDFQQENMQEAESEFDEDGFEWLTIFNKDGSMENIRIPVTFEVSQQYRAMITLTPKIP